MELSITQQVNGILDRASRDLFDVKPGHQVFGNPARVVIEVRIRHKLESITLRECQEFTSPQRLICFCEELVTDPRDITVADELKLVGQQGANKGVPGQTMPRRLWPRRSGRASARCAKALRSTRLGDQELPD